MKIKILLSSLLISSFSWGQISTDRPDQTEASVVLPKNMLQIESGVIFQDEEVFNTLFRYGISEKFELRLNTNYLQLDSPDGLNIPSPRFGDIEIGAKIQIFKSSGDIKKAIDEQEMAGDVEYENYLKALEAEPVKADGWVSVALIVALQPTASPTVTV